jgi:hypothetical protein
MAMQSGYRNSDPKKTLKKTKAEKIYDHFKRVAKRAEASKKKEVKA